MPIDDAELNELSRRVALGDQEALGTLVDFYRPRLRAMLQLRIDRRVRGRIDASDVLQETFLEVSARLGEFVQNSPVPFYFWLRRICGQRLATAYRFHLGTQARDAGRDISLFDGAFPAANSAELAARLVGRLSSPSTAAVRAELRAQLETVLNGMDEIDREIIVLRHFEELTNSEAAQLLDIKPSAACNRHVRALEHLRRALDEIPGFAGEMWK
jgi:RNA polymerase sigma-70 factor (ECF subfamily)